MSEQTIPTEDSKHPGGRPTLYNPETVGKLRGMLELGFSVEKACAGAGIAASTFYDWENKYPEFLERMTAARTYGSLLAMRQVRDVLQDINRAEGRIVDPNTQQKIEPKYSEVTRINTAKWWLEKKEKEVFGSQSVMAAKLESDGKGGQTATVIYATDNQLDQLLERTLERLGSNQVSDGQLLEVSEESTEAEGVFREGDQGGVLPVHSEGVSPENTESTNLP